MYPTLFATPKALSDSYLLCLVADLSAEATRCPTRTNIETRDNAIAEAKRRDIELVLLCDRCESFNEESIIGNSIDVIYRLYVSDRAHAVTREERYLAAFRACMRVARLSRSVTSGLWEKEMQQLYDMAFAARMENRSK